MDNKIFNVNGRTKEQLRKALDLLLTDEWENRPRKKVPGWYVDPKKGLVLVWHLEKDGASTGFPAALSCNMLAEIMWEWLQSDEAKAIPHEGWDLDADHDGSNEQGWRLYTEDWGCVTNANGFMDTYSIAAFKPAYLWYGK